jgi:hypothetical protein
MNDPIAQVFAGVNIDLDNFVSTLGLDKRQRQVNITNDPYAAAKFFHFMINTILETLFQIKVNKYHNTSEMGLLG